MRDRNWYPAWPHGPSCGIAPSLVLCCLLLPTLAIGSERRRTPIVRAVQSVRESVVNIRGEKTVVPPGPQPGITDPARRVNGMGTGVVIDPQELQKGRLELPSPTEAGPAPLGL